MTRTYATAEHVETYTDVLLEQVGNIANYNVVSGCEPSFSDSDLTVTVASGIIVHNGSRVTVPGSTITLVPDVSNPLWAWVGLDSSGAAVVVHGTSASNPTEPELGDYVEVAKVLVDANQTIAAHCSQTLDKRMFGQTLVTISSGTSGASAVLSADFTTTSVISNITDFRLPVVTGTTYVFKLLLHYTCSATADYVFGLTAPGRISVQPIEYDLTATGIVGANSLNNTYSAYANGFGSTTPGVVAVHGSLITTADGYLQVRHASVDTSGKTKSKSRLELY